MATERAHITPEVLIWARERAYLDVDAAAKRAGVSPERYVGWETGQEGTSPPTMRMAERLADLFMVPLATLFRESVPDWDDPIVEMRRLPGGGTKPSAALVKQLRLAYSRRDFALSVYQNLEEDPPPFGLSATIDESADLVAQRLRFALNVPAYEQSSWRKNETALSRWRQQVEALNVLVFQVPYVNLSEMRGFCIAEEPLPVVGYNSLDSYAGKTFSLIHEVVHLMLGQSTLEDHRLSVLSEDSRVESFCNQVAASTLMPVEVVEAHELVQDHGQNGLWSAGEIDRVARYFCVSGSAALRRLHHAGYVAPESYEYLREEFDSRTFAKKRKKGGDPILNALSWIGRPLLQIAFSGVYHDVLNPRDVAELARYHDLGKLEKTVTGKSFMFE